MKNHGINTERQYPVVSDKTVQPGPCRFDKGSSVLSVDQISRVNAGDEQALLEAVALVGPISVAVHAEIETFKYYTGGIYNDDRCSDEEIEHAVLLVGYGEEKGTKFWIVKNSWGTEWGENGYARMLRNDGSQLGMCRILQQASFATISNVQQASSGSSPSSSSKRSRFSSSSSSNARFGFSIVGVLTSRLAVTNLS